jgi:uncharacterized cupin superfamily protein
MSNYAIVNLKQLEDSAAGQAAGIEARFARKHLGSEHIGVTYMRYEPSVRSPMAHSHREQEEVYVVTGGAGKVRLDDEVHDVRQWDVVRVSPATIRAFEAGPQGMEFLAVGSQRPERGDGIKAPTAWIE